MIPEKPVKKLPLLLERSIDQVNFMFNGLSLRNKRASVIVFGITAGLICLSLIFGNCDDKNSTTVDKITLPRDAYKSKPDSVKHLLIKP